MKITTFSESKELIKEGLLFYSSDENKPLVDNSGKPHIITPETIQALAHNTNEYLKLSDIYVFPDHDRDPKKALGLISDSGCFEAKEITEDIANQYPKLKPLVGRWGLFCNNVRLVEEQIIDKVSKGLSKSLSIGADLVNNVVRELSLTATPAAIGSALFNSNIKITKFTMNNPDAITLEDALAEGEKQEELEEEAEKLLDIFIKVVCNLKSKSDEELAQLGTDKKTAFDTSLQQLTAKLTEMFDPTAQDQAMKQQAVNSMNPQMQQPQMQYSLDEVLASFNGSTVEELEQYLAEFGLLGDIGKKIGARVASGVAAAGTQTGLLNKAKGFAGAATQGLGKKLKTNVANTVASGLNKAGSLGTRLSGSGNKVVAGIGKAIEKKANNAGMGLSNRRLDKYSSKTKLTTFSK